jgi:hypothetical protein
LQQTGIERAFVSLLFCLDRMIVMADRSTTTCPALDLISA